MNKKLLLAFLAPSLLTQTSVAENTVTANLGINSNYVWRGVTQSDDHASVSAGIDYSQSSGFYAGAWAASVDFNDDTNFEYDFYAGYQYQLTNVTFDIGMIYYGYQGQQYLDFSELYLKANYENFSFAINTLADSDFKADFGDATYYEAGYSMPFVHELTLDLHAGYYHFKHDENYQDYGISLSKGNFALTVSKLTGNDSLEDTLVSLSYTHSFDL